LNNFAARGLWLHDDFQHHGQLSRFDEDTPVMVHNPRGKLAELEEVKNTHAFFLRIMEIVPSGLCLAIDGRHFRFSVFSDDHKPRGELLVHQDAIVNLGAELAERVGRQLLGFASRRA
jgi:hypothetical protein